MQPASLLLTVLFSARVGGYEGVSTRLISIFRVKLWQKCLFLKIIFSQRLSSYAAHSCMFCVFSYLTSFQPLKCYPTTLGARVLKSLLLFVTWAFSSLHFYKKLKYIKKKSHQQVSEVSLESSGDVTQINNWTAAETHAGSCSQSLRTQLYKSLKHFKTGCR